MRTVQGNMVVRVTVRWTDVNRQSLHFLVTGPRGGTQAGFIVRLTDLFDELSRLGVWESIGIPVRDPGSNRVLYEAQHTIRDLLAVLEELISIVDDSARDDYVPDSFTTRPAKRVIRKLRQCSDATNSATSA